MICKFCYNYSGDKTQMTKHEQFCKSNPNGINKPKEDYEYKLKKPVPVMSVKPILEEKPVIKKKVKKVKKDD